MTSADEKLSPRTWHRRASRPVSIWMSVFLLAGLAHPVIPDGKWLLVHIFTLGILTNSIMLWSQTLTERFLQRRLPDSARRGQLARTYVLNAGVIAVLAGRRHYLLAWVGAALVAAALAWHAVVLGRQVAASGRGQRHRPAAVGYVASACCLPVGALFGAALAAGANERLRAAHLIVNVGGFVGLAVMASLSVLFPAIWRVNLPRDRAGVSVPLAAAGLVLAVPGALAGVRGLALAGLVVYTAAWVWIFEGFLVTVIDVARDPRGHVTYPGLAVFASLLWLIGTLVWYCARLAVSSPEIPTLALLLGFAAQVLIGAMSYLIPTTMGGGPEAVRAGLAELDRAGWVRFAVFNVALAGWLIASGSWARIVFSLLAFGALVAFLPLMARAAKTQAAAIRAQSAR